jgi:hypothetical protein
VIINKISAYHNMVHSVTISTNNISEQLPHVMVMIIKLYVYTHNFILNSLSKFVISVLHTGHSPPRDDHGSIHSL